CGTCGVASIATNSLRGVWLSSSTSAAPTARAGGWCSNQLRSPYVLSRLALTLTYSSPPTPLPSTASGSVASVSQAPCATTYYSLTDLPSLCRPSLTGLLSAPLPISRLLAFTFLHKRWAGGTFARHSARFFARAANHTLEPACPASDRGSCRRAAGSGVAP